ncbi:hypothetical protein MLOOGBEN_06695 [Bacillus sp. EB106-08-02-XG196]|nr:hypothetical protein [Bacillus sp. EB106-08-02-XG196]NWQ40386.1 hypothetical protein [Bacillus sp. EB106-08-02-XG196]
MIYSDRQYEIHRLQNTPGYKIVAEIWKEDRLIAALFTKGVDKLERRYSH